ncbi:hypothetical protein PAEAM_27510 [Paenibacillus sp. GM1FR]|uniref:hypothetical protein n=1 Tax=Paenibacillus sp. GM1FR TaxID=2059267 RepID=UPI000C27EE97|nr:hypothetical protein [Paenibacillus sp. GM1FR]PJN60191.1 hypothetical protein PAEAM_27510 [Paenibacillus sp. GM1FR]
MNNRVTVPLYASLLSVALLTASCSSGDPQREGEDKRLRGREQVRDRRPTEAIPVQVEMRVERRERRLFRIRLPYWLKD